MVYILCKTLYTFVDSYSKKSFVSMPKFSKHISLNDSKQRTIFELNKKWIDNGGELISAVNDNHVLESAVHVKRTPGRPITTTSSSSLTPGAVASILSETASQSDEINDSDDIQESKKYNSWSEVMKLTLKYHCHRWANDGSHIDFNDNETIYNEMKRLFPSVKRKTLNNKITKERHGIPDGKIKALIKRPDLNAAFNDMNQRNDVEKSSNGNNFIFPPDLYEELTRQIKRVQKTPGFGTRTVKICAAKLYKSYTEKTGIEYDNWTPSDSWCLNYLKEKMHFSHRRVKQNRSIRTN